MANFDESLDGAKVEICQGRFPEGGSAEVGSAEVSPAEVSSAEVGFDEVDSAEVSPAEVGSAEVSPAEVSLAEVGFDEVGPAEVGKEVGPAEVGPAEVGPAEVGSDEVGSAEVGPAEVGKAEVKFYIWMLFSPSIPRCSALLYSLDRILIGHEMPPLLLFISISIFPVGCNEEKRTFEVFLKNEERFLDLSTNRPVSAMCQNRTDRPIGPQGLAEGRSKLGEIRTHHEHLAQPPGPPISLIARNAS